MSEPKKRHYDSANVQKFISRQRQLRLQQKSIEERDKKNKQEVTKLQLFVLENKSKQLLAASVRRRKPEKSEQSTKSKFSSSSPAFSMKDLHLNFSTLKSPSVSSKSSIRGSNNRLSDEFIEEFVQKHQPRPAHQQIILSKTSASAQAAATKIQAAFRGFRTRKKLAPAQNRQKKVLPSFEFVDRSLRETAPDPFSFIQTVKRLIKIPQKNF